MSDARFQVQPRIEPLLLVRVRCAGGDIQHIAVFRGNFVASNSQRSWGATDIKLGKEIRRPVIDAASVDFRFYIRYMLCFETRVSQRSNLGQFLHF